MFLLQKLQFCCKDLNPAAEAEIFSKDASYNPAENNSDAEEEYEISGEAKTRHKFSLDYLASCIVAIIDAPECQPVMAKVSEHERFRILSIFVSLALEFAL